ncbi:MAG TPA: hypothetical protein VGG28_06335 [Kofleriaceae bacterium]|jgi:hypothetical protein
MRVIPMFAVLASSAVASATPNALAVGFGYNSEVDSSSNDGGYTLDARARAGVSDHVGVQIDVDHSSSTNADITAATVSATLDLVDHGSWVPMLLGGAGLDWTSGTQSGEHAEVGGALEFRASGGFLIGLDIRVGLRHVDGSPPEEVEPGFGGGMTDGPAFVPIDPSSNTNSLPSGFYGMARFYAGVHF